jgi:hypothetical protein
MNYHFQRGAVVGQAVSYYQRKYLPDGNKYKSEMKSKLSKGLISTEQHCQ